jgi:D-glycero-alpha-D-manno-heptose 1-phosphate guanylyltransferase
MDTFASGKSTAGSGADVRICDSMPAVLLVGGLGTRLRSLLPSTPKPLASVGNKSFLELLIHQLRFQGLSRIIMCTGYLADQIEGEFGDGSDFGVAIEYSKEMQPQGTAGAVRLAEQHLKGCSEFLVMNGDSFLEIDLSRLVRFHRGHRGLVSMAAVQVENAGRYGTVRLDTEKRVSGFLEKTGSDARGLINAGVYVFNRAIFDWIPKGPASLERDVFPSVLNLGVYAFPQDGIFIDIGTPDDYLRAQQLCGRLYEVAVSRKGAE